MRSSRRAVKRDTVMPEGALKTTAVILKAAGDDGNITPARAQITNSRQSAAVCSHSAAMLSVR